ncbi:MAG: DUF4892 domain-containing protein [Pseudomonas sp.]|uniref:DUF4892 domain-containing protein n=1 Tax=Pseudomonas sp. TaxID=306 RepID=UPI00339437CE
MNSIVRFSAWLLLALATGGGSVVADEVPGSQDLPFLPRFAQSQVSDFQDSPNQERIYPQGAVRRISGQLRLESQVLVQGHLTALTYQLPASHSAGEAFQAARQTLQRQGAQLLYWCQGRECGSSSLWANEVFGSGKLSGVDEQQAYLLARLAEPRQDSLLVVYGTTRGNQRAVLHVEQLQSAAPLPNILPTPGTLLRLLREQGELKLPELTAPSERWSLLLARTLNQDSSLRISLAGVNANAWRDALIEEGVRAARLELNASDTTGLNLQLLR